MYNIFLKFSGTKIVTAWFWWLWTKTYPTCGDWVGEGNCWLSIFFLVLSRLQYFTLPRGTDFLSRSTSVLTCFCDSLTCSLWRAWQKTFAETLMDLPFHSHHLLPKHEIHKNEWVCLVETFPLSRSHRPYIRVNDPFIWWKNTGYLLFIQDTQLWNWWTKRTVIIFVPD